MSKGCGDKGHQKLLVRRGGDKMLGLERGKVKLVGYEPEWEKIFESERETLNDILGTEGLEPVITHVGSTSIKGMLSKPIIDIAVGFDNQNQQIKGFNKLKASGMHYVSAVKLPGLYLMSKGDPVQFHYHVVVRNTYAWNRLILFRNHLKKNPRLIKEYEELKIELAGEYEENRYQYTLGKKDYVEAVLFRATGKRRREHRETALRVFSAMLKKNGINL